MKLTILLFLGILPGLIGAGLHFFLTKRPYTTWGKLILSVIYGFGAFWLSLLMKYLLGWGNLDLFSSFNTVISLFKYGTIELVAVVFVPLALSCLCSLLHRSQAGKGVMQFSKEEKLRFFFLVIVAAIGIALLICFSRTPPVTDGNADSEKLTQESEVFLETEAVGQSAPDIIQKTLETVRAQTEIDNYLISELKSNRYTMEKPFVAVDPYGVAPLTAMVLFSTDVPTQISIHVPGETELGNVDFTFGEYKTEHQIPVYGLYPDQANQVTLTAITESGDTKTCTVEIQTDSLPPDLQNAAVKIYFPRPEEYQRGFNFLFCNASNIKAAIDANGDYRWYLRQSVDTSPLGTQVSTCARYVDNGTLFITCGESDHAYGTADPVCILQITMMGKILNIYYSPYGNHHEITLTSQNTLLAAGANPSTPDTVQDSIYEIDLKTGEVLHFLDYKRVLSSTRIYDYRGFAGVSDWCHINSIAEYGSNVVVSSNFQSTVICNDWSGNIKWMLCEKAGYPAMYWDKILTPVGDDFEYCYGQHNVTILPDTDGNLDTLDILLFDNGTTRNYNNTVLQNELILGNTIEPPLYSRMVVYRINEEKMTVEQLWSYGKQRTELYSQQTSSAQCLQNRNMLGMFSVSTHYNDFYTGDLKVTYHPVFVEINAKGDIVFECHIEKGTQEFEGYRGYRYSIYASNANENNLGIVAKNFIPPEILANYGYEKDSEGDCSSSWRHEVSSTGEPVEEEAWSLSLEGYKVYSELRTVESVPQYTGATIDVCHDNVPKDGMQFLLLNLTVTKKLASSSYFSWNDLSLMLNGKTYTRMENDSFLIDHNYERMPGIDLKLGSKSGWICMEIPKEADLSTAVLIYRGTDGVREIQL